MAEEIIRFGAGGVPYKPTTPPPIPEPEVEEDTGGYCRGCRERSLW